MITHFDRPLRRLGALGLLALLPAMPAFGHVILDAPNGGEQLEAGGTFDITWHIHIQHNTMNWDLEYSTVGTGGPWLPIASDLPLGAPDVGAPHVYSWTVPDDVAAAAWVRVIQDNGGMDYDDISDVPIAIVAPPCQGDTDGNGQVDIDDVVNVVLDFGTDGQGHGGDVDGNGSVDIDDVVLVVLSFGACPGA